MSDTLQQQTAEKIQKLSIDAVKNLRIGQGLNRRNNSSQTFNGLPEQLTFTIVNYRYYKIEENGDITLLDKDNKVHKDLIDKFEKKVESTEKTKQFDPNDSKVNPDNIRKSLGLESVTGHFVSENMLTATKLINETFEPNQTKYPKKSLFKSETLSNFKGTPDAILADLQGKTVNIEPVTYVYYKNDIFTNFVDKAPILTESTKEEQSDHFEAITEEKNGYIFTIEE